MKRSTLILGFALLVVAATLAITITFRNDPRVLTTAPEASSGGSARASAPRDHDPGRAALRSGAAHRDTRVTAARDRFEVTIPAEALTDLTPGEQAESHRRADAIQRAARGKLERMTEEFDLTATQRAKMFPVLVRSTPGYDPAMQVAGVHLDTDPLTPAGEEMHELFDPDQQAQLEDKEVDRQLWWQDLFDRIETDLIDSTGGMPMQGPEDSSSTVVDPVDPDDERSAPTSRGGATR